MIILNILESIFNVLVPISIFVLLIVEIKRISSHSSKNNAECTYSNTNKNNPQWENMVEGAILITTALVFLVLIFLLLLKIKNRHWIIRIITIPVYLEQFIIIYQSIGIIQQVVKSNDNKKLTFKELTAINTLAYLIWFLKIQIIFEKIIKRIYNTSYIYLADMLVAFSYILIFSLYIFFICAISSELTIIVLNITKNICDKLPWKAKIQNLEYYWINKIGENITFKSTLILQWNFIEKQNKHIRWIRYLLLPITFILDVIIMLGSIAISLIICSIGYIFLLIKMLKRTLIKLANWLLNLSDKRIIAISFRLSIIMALVCIVILNRYQPIFKIQESSTAILEFIASAIIIPIVFEWINSFKKNM